jgi:formyltetrahydrofolate-dependent phosphoribosylglycinamide formyltransferase
MPAGAVIPRDTTKPLRLAVLISGGGTTLLNLTEHIRSKALPAEVALVICSNDKAAGVERARQLGLPVQVIARRRFDGVGSFSLAVFDTIRRADAQLVCLAGFLSLLEIPGDFAWRIINVHPSLLPSFGGKGMFGHHVHEAVLAAGCKVSGCTVHFADQTYDTGPILVQRCCPVREDDTPDTLAKRVFEQECVAYPEAVRLLATGRVRIEGRRVRIEGEAKA